MYQNSLFEKRGTGTSWDISSTTKGLLGPLGHALLNPRLWSLQTCLSIFILEDIWQFLTKLHIHLPYDQVFLGVYSKELKIYVHTKTCTWRFLAALCKIAKALKQPRHPSVRKWINKLEYYLALKKKSYQAMKRYGKTLNAYDYMKEASLKRLHIIWL